MPGRIPQDFIDDLINRLDIVEVVDERVKLKRSGKNYMACCPFHEEKTPSFTVSPDKQFYYCFGCGATGTALGFVMEYDRVGFVDAVETLARRAGLEVPREERPNADREEGRRRGLYEVLEQAGAWYSAQLKSHPQRHSAVKYLKNRGLDGHIAKFFGLGYAPPGWDNLLLALGTSESQKSRLVDAGLAIEKPEENRLYDRFRNRIMYPIRDSRGRTIGFGGRVLGDDKPKYLNSPETPVFEKGRELYGLWEARQKNRQLDFLLVVEGYMDVIAMAQYGIWNAVATLGTACGEAHLQLAFRQVSEVVFCFDGDNAGRGAAKRALMNSLSSMEDGRQIKFLFLPEGQDPDSLVRQIGADRFRALIKRGLPLEEFLFQVAAENCDLNSMEGRARFSKKAAPLIHQLPEGVFRSLMLDNLARRTGLSRDTLDELTELPEELRQLPEEVQAKAAQPENPQPAPSAQIPRKSQMGLTPARRALILLLDQPQLLREIPDIDPPSPAMLEREDCQTLFDIVSFLHSRPEANFNIILGYWAGSRGDEAQRTLSQMVAHELMDSLKSVQNYNPLRELQDCLQHLRDEDIKLQRKLELDSLNRKGFNQLSEDERARYRELISAPSQPST